MKLNWMFGVLVSAGLCGTSLGQITGSVKLDGDPPAMAQIDMSSNPQCAQLHKDPVFDDSVVVGDKGELANVVVSIKPADGQTLTGPVPTQPATLLQKGCMYHPHVVAAMVGQDVTIKSDDEFLHNVHTLSVDNDPVNFAQNKQPGDPDPEKNVQFSSAETFVVKCDIHPWMKAWIVILPHPYFAVTGVDGKYSIETKGLPDGKYTLDFWQEKFGDQTQEITVKDGKATADCTFKSKEKADATPIRSGQTVSYASVIAAPCCAGKAVASK